MFCYRNISLSACYHAKERDFKEAQNHNELETGGFVFQFVFRSFYAFSLIYYKGYQCYFKYGLL